MDQASLIEFGNSLKWYAGFIIMANLGTIGSLLFVGYKAVWWLSKLDSRVTHAQETANRAHQRVDKVEDKLSNWS